MTRADFTYKTDCKGKIFKKITTGYEEKIRNKSVYCVFYKGGYLGTVMTKKDAERFIANLIKYHKLTYTAEYR